MNAVHKTTYLSEVETLANAGISEDLPRFFPNGMPEQLITQVGTSKLLGEKVVCVYWPTGEVAVMPCMPGMDFPPSGKIIAAYWGCKELKERSTEGGLA